MSGTVIYEGLSRSAIDIARDQEVTNNGGDGLVYEVPLFESPGMLNSGSSSGGGSVKVVDPVLDDGTTTTSATIPDTNVNFEGLSNADNDNVFGFRIRPPDTVGAVGPK